MLLSPFPLGPAGLALVLILAHEFASFARRLRTDRRLDELAVQVAEMKGRMDGGAPR